MKEIAIEKKKNRCSRFGRSLGAHNLTNRIHIQLHLPDEICYLSCSSKCFIFFLQLIFFSLFHCSLYLFSSILFVHGLRVVLLCVCALHREVFFFLRSTFSSSFGVFNDNVAETSSEVGFFFGEYSSMLPVSAVS